MPSLSLPPLSIERGLRFFDPEVTVTKSDSLDYSQCTKSVPKSITLSTCESVENESIPHFTEEFYDAIEKYLEEEEGLSIMSPRSTFKTETVVELEKLPAFDITTPAPNSFKIPSILMRRANLKSLKIPE